MSSYQTCQMQPQRNYVHGPKDHLSLGIYEEIEEKYVLILFWFVNIVQLNKRYLQT